MSFDVVGRCKAAVSTYLSEQDGLGSAASEDSAFLMLRLRLITENTNTSHSYNAVINPPFVCERTLSLFGVNSESSRFFNVNLNILGMAGKKKTHSINIIASICLSYLTW